MLRPEPGGERIGLFLLKLGYRFIGNRGGMYSRYLRQHIILRQELKDTCHLLLIKAASFDFFGMLAPGRQEFQERIEEKLLFGGRYYQAAHTTYIVGSRAGNEAACFIDVDVHSLFAFRKSDAELRLQSRCEERIVRIEMNLRIARSHTGILQCHANFGLRRRFAPLC